MMQSLPPLPISCPKGPDADIATMQTDGTIIWTVTMTPKDGPKKRYERKLSPGSGAQQQLLDRVGGLKVGETKCVPPEAPTIGSARMNTDGVIELGLFMTAGDIDHPTYGQVQLRYRPGDPNYDVVLKQAGGLRPGESKAFPPPWPAPPQP